ncbi:transposase family protein, partial [uncultured Nostoc sp.]|uniref:transposase family protein n=1 Tax=uncultured Nostoc sp. TaxID=340711 RepID=UPI0035CC623A
ERPKRKQQEFYSGKKKRHTLKSQLIIRKGRGQEAQLAEGNSDSCTLPVTKRVLGLKPRRLHGANNIGRGLNPRPIVPSALCPLPSAFFNNQETGEIICTFFGKGRCHDFALFKASGIHFHPETQGLYDSGYQGINQYHSNSYTPKKKPKKGELSILQKDYNRLLAKERIGIEHINRRLKIFKILGDRYRNRRRRYGLRCNLLAAIYNYELILPEAKFQTITIT